MRTRLRIFNGEDCSTALESRMTMSFGDLMQILDDASRGHRTWLRDFSEDGIEVPEDLYEVLTEYVRLRPGA